MKKIMIFRWLVITTENVYMWKHGSDKRSGKFPAITSKVIGVTIRCGFVLQTMIYEWNYNDVWKKSVQLTTWSILFAVWHKSVVLIKAKRDAGRSKTLSGRNDIAESKSARSFFPVSCLSDIFAVTGLH